MKASEACGGPQRGSGQALADCITDTRPDHMRCTRRRTCRQPVPKRVSGEAKSIAFEICADTRESWHIRRSHLLPSPGWEPTYPQQRRIVVRADEQELLGRFYGRLPCGEAAQPSRNRAPIEST